MAEPTVLSLEEAGAGAWDGYVRSHPQATLFHRSGWANVLGRTDGFRPCFLAARVRGRVAGVLPLAEVRQPLFARALVSTPFAAYGGALADSDPVAEALENAAVDLGTRRGAGYVELRNTARRRAEWQDHGHFQTFVRDLPSDPDAVAASIPRKQRAEVRAAEKKGLEIARDMDLDSFHALFARAMRDHGSPVFARAVLHRVAHEFGGSIWIHAARVDGQPVAAVLSYLSGSAVLPYYAAAHPGAHGYGAFPALYAAIMRDAVEAGIQTFDFGRSPAGSGSARFKRNMGFQPTDLAYQVYPLKRAEVAVASPTNPKYRLAIAIWKRLPLPVANRLGPMIAPAVV